MTPQFSGVELARVSAVLQDCVDQLAVLGNIMPHTCQGPSVLSEATQELLSSQKQLNRVLDEMPIFSDHLVKVQRDREFAAHALMEVMAELQENGTFHSLLQAVGEERKKKIDLQDIISREEESRHKAKTLQKQLLNIRKEQTLELEKRDDMITKLKDRLQEMEKKSGVEKIYIQISTEHLVKQNKKLNTHKEKELEDEKMILQQKHLEEKKANTEMESFLKKHQDHLEEKLNYWRERHHQDMEDKQQQMYTLNIKSKNNMGQIQEIIKKQKEYEQAILEYKQEMKSLLEVLKREQLLKKATARIQAWWRTIQMKKGLGPYKKKQKGKKGQGKKKK